ncbi:unnamed protein product, partial [Timema podura]|nr:unnamed protein product [Timema podura]
MTKKSQKEFKEQLQVDHEMQKMEQKKKGGGGLDRHTPAASGVNPKFSTDSATKSNQLVGRISHSFESLFCAAEDAPTHLRSQGLIITAERRTAALQAYMKDVEASADYSSKIIQEKLTEKQAAKKSEPPQPCLPVNSSTLEKLPKKQASKKSESSQPYLPVNSSAVEKLSKKQAAKKSEPPQPSLPVNTSTLETKTLECNKTTVAKETKKPVEEDKKWYEAKSAEGHTYYWHVET